MAEAEGMPLTNTVASAWPSGKPVRAVDVNEVADQDDGSTHFAVNIIPHTQAVTTLADLEPGRAVNIEIDVLARYLQRMEHYRARQ